MRKQEPRIHILDQSVAEGTITLAYFNTALITAVECYIEEVLKAEVFKGCYDTQHNHIQHNDTQHNDIQHNDTQDNDTQHNDIQHNDTQHNDIQYNSE